MVSWMVDSLVLQAVVVLQGCGCGCFRDGSAEVVLCYTFFRKISFLKFIKTGSCILIKVCP